MITCPQCDSGIEQIIETAPGQGIWRCRGCKALYVQDAPLKPMKRPSQGPLADTLRTIVSLETELSKVQTELAASQKQTSGSMKMQEIEGGRCERLVKANASFRDEITRLSIELADARVKGAKE